MCHGIQQVFLKCLVISFGNIKQDPLKGWKKRLPKGFFHVFKGRNYGVQMYSDEVFLDRAQIVAVYCVFESV